MYRLHSVRRDCGIVIATYRDEPLAHSPIPAEKAKAEFLGTCDRTIGRLERELAEWRGAKAEAAKLTEADFVEVGTTFANVK